MHLEVVSDSAYGYQVFKDGECIGRLRIDGPNYYRNYWYYCHVASGSGRARWKQQAVRELLKLDETLAAALGQEAELL